MLRESNNLVRWINVSFAMAVLLVFGEFAWAGGVIDTLVHTTDASPISLDATQKDLRKASQDLVNSQGAYASLAGRPFTAVYSVAGAKNVLQLTADATRQTLTITDLRTGKFQTFVGANEAATVDQLSTFLETNADKAFTGYQTTLNTKSSVGVTDGNPLAATAVLANDAFTQFGFVPNISQAPIASVGRATIGLQGGGGTYSANDANGSFADLDLNVGVRLADQVALAVSIPFEYRTVGGTSTWILGLNLGVPVTIISHNAGWDGFAWQVSPWVDLGGGVNTALLSGGGIYGGGGTSSLSYQMGHFTFTLADQIGYDSGFGFQLYKIDFNTPVNQWLLKNGVRVDYDFWQNCFVDVGVAYTNFLAAAAIHGYVSPNLGVGFRFGPHGSSDFQVNYVGDFGNNSYQDAGLQMILRMRF